MATNKAPLGFTEATKRTTVEEDDLIERSAKKKKGGEKPYEPSSSVPVSYADIQGSPRMGEHKTRSYKASVLGATSDNDFEEEETIVADDGEDERAWRDGDAKAFTGMAIIERQLGEHACPDFVLTEEEEARLQKTMEEWSGGEVVREEDWLQSP
ncbi:hypothetical protein P8452_17081 [Trifolium repens]|nr:hypothetical protein P8452_17081 [Trifolium repens]